MDKADLQVYALKQPLRVPYRLSFDTLTAFDSLIVSLSSAGRAGYGEITPLPGYSDETVSAALEALKRAARRLEDGAPPEAVIEDLVGETPMTASALACAFETWVEGEQDAFRAPLAEPVPLAALCGGDSPEEASETARALVRQGYRHLKLKAGGGDIRADIERVRAVAAAVPAAVDLSVDANQRLSFDDARRLCEASAELPVALVEQPFEPLAWEDFERLVADSPVPLMLDESIWTAADIDRAAAAGAQWVKLKLCKHPGLAANRRLLEQACGLGLGVIYGNGVQGALGNHLESRIYADTGLDTPGEMNGVLKLSKDPFSALISVEQGYLSDRGVPKIAEALGKEVPVLTASFML